MFCPQCGTGLGEGARGCAACGWTASRKTLWIVLGCIFGGLLLICCGGTVFLGLRMKKAAEALNPPLVFLARTLVLNWAKKHDGSLPESLEKAREEPLEGGGRRLRRFDDQNAGGALHDTWGGEIRYTPGKDGSYEVRSAGPDGTFDNADDIVEKGHASDDLEAVKREAEARFVKLEDEFVRAIGFDPDKAREKRKERRGKAEGAPPEAKPAESPPNPEGGEPKPPEAPK